MSQHVLYVFRTAISKFGKLVDWGRPWLLILNLSWCMLCFMFQSGLDFCKSDLLCSSYSLLWILLLIWSLIWSNLIPSILPWWNCIGFHTHIPRLHTNFVWLCLNGGMVELLLIMLTIAFHLNFFRAWLICSENHSWWLLYLVIE